MKTVKLLVAAAFFASLSLLADEQVTLKVVYNTFRSKWFEPIIKDFENTHKNIKINAIAISSETYDTKISMMLNSTDSDIDVLYTDSTMLKGFIEAKKLSPVPGFKEWDQFKQFDPVVLSGNSEYQGEYYGVPINTNTRGLWYNVNIFRETGLPVPWNPQNWADIIDACRKIKEKNPKLWPILFSIKGANEATSMQTAFMLISGTRDPLFKDGRWITESQGLYDSLKFIYDIYKNNLGAPMSLFFGQKDVDIYSVYPGKQQVAIMLDGNWICFSWYKNCPDAFKNYDFTRMPTEFGQDPGFVTAAGGEIFVMPLQGKNKKEAFEFIKLATSKENILKFTLLWNDVAPRIDTQMMDGYPEVLKKPSALLKYARFRPINNDYPAVSIELSTAVENVATQKMSAEETMKTYADNVERLVGKDKVDRESYKAD